MIMICRKHVLIKYVHIIYAYKVYTTYLYNLFYDVFQNIHLYY